MSARLHERAVLTTVARGSTVYPPHRLQQRVVLTATARDSLVVVTHRNGGMEFEPPNPPN